MRTNFCRRLEDLCCRSVGNEIVFWSRGDGVEQPATRISACCGVARSRIGCGSVSFRLHAAFVGNGFPFAGRWWPAPGLLRASRSDPRCTTAGRRRTADIASGPAILSSPRRSGRGRPRPALCSNSAERLSVAIGAPCKDRTWGLSAYGRAPGTPVRTATEVGVAFSNTSMTTSPSR